MAKIKCFCKEPYRGLGRTLYGYYKSQNRMVENHLGVMELHRSDPICVPIQVSAIDGTFELDDIKQNREILKQAIIKGRVELDDLELQQEIVGPNKVAAPITIVEHVEKEVIVQKAGKIDSSTPKYGDMTFAAKPLNEKLEENLAKYKAKKEERKLARELRKQKNKILAEEAKEEKVLQEQEIERDLDEKELADLIDLNGDSEKEE